MYVFLGLIGLALVSTMFYYIGRYDGYFDGRLEGYREGIIQRTSKPWDRTCGPSNKTKQGRGC